MHKKKRGPKHKKKRGPKPKKRKISFSGVESRSQRVEEACQKIQIFVPSDTALIIADYALPDSNTNLLIPIKRQPDLFYPAFYFDKKFQDFYQDVTGRSLLRDDGCVRHPLCVDSLDEAIEIEENYRKMINDKKIDVAKRNVSPSLMFVSHTVSPEYCIFTFLFKFMNNYYLQDNEDKADYVQSIIKLIKYMMDIDNRSVNICCKDRGCCDFQHDSPLSLALNFDYGREPLVKFLRERGATVPGKALEPQACY